MINFGRGRPGRLGAATRRWADALEVDGSRVVLVQLARDAADLADAARSAGEGSLYLSAASRLQQLMDRVERGSRDGDPGAAGVGADDWARELARLMGAGPEVGDASES